MTESMASPQGFPSTTYERLRHSMTKRMRMSHIYQPLMLMELLGRGFARQQPARPLPQDVARRIGGDELSDRGSVSGRGQDSGFIVGEKDY